MFFESWWALWRLVVVIPISFVALVALLRIMGKRSLAKMNAFDFVVTVAMGSVWASTMISKPVKLFEGVLALALLLGLQYAVTSLSVRSERFADLIKSEPTLLMHNGSYVHGAMRRQRVTRSEIDAAIRQAGNGSRERVSSVVLETDGTFSVIGNDAIADEFPLGISPEADVRRG